MPETAALLQAINELKNVVSALTRVIEDDYPKREEVERRFTTKKQSWNKLWIGLTMLALSLPVSLFVSVSMITTCFLGSEGDEYPAVCNAMPGYSSSRDDSDALIKEFRRLQSVTERNDKRLDRIERMLARR